MAVLAAYQLYRKLGSGSYALVYSGGSTSHAASSLAAGSYTYRVRAYKTTAVTVITRVTEQVRPSR